VLEETMEDPPAAGVPPKYEAEEKHLEGKTEYCQSDAEAPSSLVRARVLHLG